MATPKIRSANAASTSSLAPTLPRTITVPLPDKSSPQNDEGAYTISLHKALSLPQAIQDRIYRLFNENMAPLSQTSSLDYTESSKREELYDETGRFILLRKGVGIEGIEGEGGVDMPGALPSTMAKESFEGNRGGNGEIVGYVSFRFDTEETLSSRDVEVIYCYELQLDPSVRRMGLANLLMDEMESIGRRRKLDKSMLTCLKANTTALSFYRKQGYEPDEIDPTRIEEEDDPNSNSEGDEAEDEDEGWEEVEHVVDYVILSKSLGSR